MTVSCPLVASAGFLTRSLPRLLSRLAHFGHAVSLLAVSLLVWSTSVLGRPLASATIFEQRLSNTWCPQVMATTETSARTALTLSTI